ncbi:MAG TPA: hypothetical protein VEA99_02965, partial [Gemmatimonadaceae bacterium]|nr:hypothetical protein [Gemmatimonadaceae bacterium]
PAGASDTITIRVEVAELWAVKAVVVEPTELVVSVKQRALAVLYPQASNHEDFVLKLRGWELLDEQATLAAAGVVDGSILLLTHRRRRAVR